MSEALLGGSILLIFAWLLIGSVGVPLPEDLALLAAGVLIHRGVVDPILAMAVVFLGVLGGDLILFSTARRLGPRAYETRLFRRLLPPERRARIELAFQRHGGRVVFAGRHLAGLRTAVFAMAGISRMAPGVFLRWDALAACITVPLTVALGYFGSAHVEAVRRGVARTEHYLVLAAALAVFGYMIWRHLQLVRHPHDEPAPARS